MEKSIESTKTYGIQFKDKMGYAMGDAAGAFSFALIGSFLQLFYTDVLLIDAGKLVLLFLVSKVWDAVNDPIWGALIDRRNPTKNGKFRPYLRWLSFPLAVATVLMFVKIPGLSENQYLIYAYITYIGYGMIYTGINIPYGSLASVITSDESERSSLSVFRSIGGGLGGLPSQILLPLLVYSAVLGSDTKVLDGTKLVIGVAVLSICSVISYNICYKYTVERITRVQNNDGPKPDLRKTLLSLIKNRAFVALCFASMFLIAMQQYNLTLYNYLFINYFQKPQLYTVVTIVTYRPMVMLIPLVSKMVKRWGKKELCGLGAILSVFANVGLMLIKTESIPVFLIFCFISGLGINFFVLEVWAMVTDLVDYHEKRTGMREEGVLYAVFSFARKLGQGLAATLGSLVLSLIGYDATNITDTVIEKMYMVATVVPTILVAGMAFFIVVVFPLNKKKLAEIYSKQD